MRIVIRLLEKKTYHLPNRRSRPMKKQRKIHCDLGQNCPFRFEETECVKHATDFAHLCTLYTIAKANTVASATTATTSAE